MTVGPSRVATSIEVRRRLGLEAAAAVVAALEADPTAVERGLSSRFGIALTEAELAAIERRPRGQRSVEAAIDAYGHDRPDTYAGRYVDEATGQVVALFVGDHTPHLEALGRLLHPRARYRVEHARWTEERLREVVDDVQASDSWFRARDTRLTGWSVDVRKNRVIIGVDSDVAWIGTAVRSRFGPDGEVDVRVSGPWRWGYGDLEVTATDAAGWPVAGLECELDPDDTRAWGGDPRGTLANGACTFKNVGATGVWVRLYRFDRDGAVEVGRVRASVEPGKTTQTHVTVLHTPGGTGHTRPTRESGLAEGQGGGHACLGTRSCWTSPANGIYGASVHSRVTTG